MGFMATWFFAASPMSRSVISEDDIRRRGAVPLVVGNDLDAVVLPHADARVGRAEVDPSPFAISPTPLSKKPHEQDPLASAARKFFEPVGSGRFYTVQERACR
jgi:hypothetical protein